MQGPPPAAGPQGPGGPPVAWDMYFPPNEYAPSDRRAVLVNDLVRFFCAGPVGSSFLEPLRQTAEGTYALEVDYGCLEAECGSADLVAAMELQPTEGLACVAVAVYEV